jgi:hypothetical protein
MPSKEIAAAAERGISSQSALITSLSIAVIGGLLAFLIQIKMHNAGNPEKKVTLNSYGVYYTALALAGLSIAIGYILTGMLIEMSPQIFSHTYENAMSFSDQKFGDVPVWALNWLSITQFGLFAGSIFFGVLFTLRNKP